MSKLLLGATAAVGTGVAGAGSTLAFSNASSGNKDNIQDVSKENDPKETQIQNTAPQISVAMRRKLLLADLDTSKSIESIYAKTVCIKDLFKNVDWSKTGLSQNSGDSNGFKSHGKINNGISDISTGTLNGCLIVEYDKFIYTQDKWKGNFQVVWALSNGSKGFIISSTARIEQSKKLLKVDGAAYSLSKSNLTWKLDGYGYRDEKTIDSSDLSKFLVQQGEAIKEPELGQYWGFDPDLSKICGTSECKATHEKETYLSSYWELESNTEQKVDGWSKNFKEWTESLFPNFFDQSKLLTNIKGSWIKKENPK